jgi:serine phosphatase RsbU (regulator of sigma subunit)
MTPEQIAAFFARREKAFARHDARALAADHAEDGIVLSPTAGTVVGRSAIEKLYRLWFTTFPDLILDIEDFFVAGDRVLEMVTLSGTDVGGFFGLPPTGREVRVSAAFVFTMKDAQILHERRILDFSGVLLQLAGEIGPDTDSLRRYRETLERARLAQELKVAAEIQRALLPRTRYRCETFEVMAASVPCRAIGGDFFDYFEFSNGGFGFALGDVAGKGPPAALLTAVLQGTFAACAQLGATPAQILKRVNDALVRRAIESRFATVVYGALSCDGRLTYCNAGHNPPLLIGKGGLRRLDKGGLIVGVFEQATFEEETVQLDPGDTLIVFSDGISEALNPDGDEFGEERLVSCVETNRELPPAILLECVLDTVQRFRADAAQNDDLTLLVLRYVGAPILSKQPRTLLPAPAIRAR